METSSSKTLKFEQVKKLNEVLQLPVEIHGSGNFPTLDIKVNELLERVCSKLNANGVMLKDVRLNGSAASYVLASPKAQHRLAYNDIDLIFSVDLSSESMLLKIKDLVIETLISYLPAETYKDKLTLCTLQEAYVSKLIKIWQGNTGGDKWSLISLSNHSGMNLELKFVDTMKRKFQFSVDSFQIILGSLLKFYTVSQEGMSADFFPSVLAESVYGDFNLALHHLNHRLIATYSPEEIKGGGLLKYCDLLSREYQHANNMTNIQNMERLMCSRFFIDYPDLGQQHQKLHSYLLNHFRGSYHQMIPYLYELHRAVRDSTICLMGHERRLTLDLIQQILYQVQCELTSYYTHPHDSMDLSPIFHDENGNQLVVEDICYGPIDQPILLSQTQQPAY